MITITTHNSFHLLKSPRIDHKLCHVWIVLIEIILCNGVIDNLCNYFRFSHYTVMGYLFRKQMYFSGNFYDESRQQSWM